MESNTTTIFLINHTATNCGVYQYGKRISNIIKNSKIYNIRYYEIESTNTLFEKIEENKPKIILYNNLECTMPWLNDDVKNIIKNKNILQGSIVHNTKYPNFDFYFHQNPYFTDLKNEFSLLRPILKFNKTHTNNSDIINIGSFGFGFKTKYFDTLCKLVNDQFDEPTQINLHLTYSYFCPNHRIIEEIKAKCFESITKPFIKINFTHDFLTDEKLLIFLSSNNLNIFLHEKYNTYQGISSSTDFGLAAKTAMAICKSNMFSHLYDTSPSICVEDNTLKNIIQNGFKPLEPKYHQWSNKNFINKFEKNISNLLF
jgi:hypothetical protein